MRIQTFKYFFLVFSFLGNINRLYSQSYISKEIRFKYVNGDDNNIYLRQYLNDSVFVEKYYFSKNNNNPSSKEFLSTGDTFKVVNKCWWYYEHGEFYPFFSLSLFNEKKMTKKYANFISKKNDNTSLFYDCAGYLPFEIQYENGKELYVFKVNYNSCDESHFTKTDIIYLYFDPSIGFIKRKFRRRDPYPSDELEIISTLYHFIP